MPAVKDLILSSSTVELHKASIYNCKDQSIIINALGKSINSINVYVISPKDSVH